MEQQQTIPRKEAREYAFVLIFQKYFNPNYTLSEILESAETFEQIKVDGFVKNLVKHCFSHLDEIDSIISKSLTNWTIDRLPSVTIAILRLGATELMFNKTNTKIVINEMIEITKKYSIGDDYKFVNGVLGNIANNVR